MYRFNSFAGRVIRDKLSLGKALKPVAGGEPTQLLFATETHFPKVSSAFLTPEDDQPKYPKVSPEIRRLQKLMQTRDGVPVHLKRGLRDKIPYYIGIFGVVFGFPYLIYQFQRHFVFNKKR